MIPCRAFLVTTVYEKCHTPDCDYPASPEWKGQAPPAYVLEITDSAGNTSQAATWNAVVGKEVTVDAATAVRLSDIVTIAVRTTGGTTVLEKDV